ncbi:MAG: SprB repeat-containing protein [Saprospiraceae bacterium]|uniref:SprB repeat-containing protein n=1 Tax=Candidatus Defluviibacterium haderslevense TaxID=2981993 RepID=A0A9D7S516_9BACT|nr:SprB repeat-containing protein [Candidatus Defluviibacterium haderslevense]
MLQDYNNFKIFHDNANRIIEIQKAECSYTKYSYDKDGNRINKLIKVIQPALEVNNTSCGLNNGSIEAFTPPGENYSYKWSTGSTQAKIINLAPGKYQLTITDLNNSNNYSCSKEFEMPSSTNPILEAKITPLGSITFCEGDTLKLKASYQLFNEYNWYRNGILVQNGIDSIYKATVGGTYWVEILNSSCSKVSPTIVLSTLSKPSPIVVPVRNPTICQSDTITLSSSMSGTSYKWNTNQSTKSIIVSTAGKYKLTITDANGCIGISPELEVKVNPLPQFTISSSINPPIFCERDSTLLTPSVNGTKYQWNTNQSTKSIYAKTTGKYNLTLTDNNQCSNTSSIDVVVNKLPKVKANSSVSELCLGQNLTLFGSGANTYFWNMGVVNNIPFKSNNSQRYVVVGTDLNGCQDTSSIYIIVNEPPVILTATSHNIKCYGMNDGEIHMLADRGQPPYQYSINGVNYQSSPDFLNLASGNYNISVRDGKGCLSQITQVQIFEYVTELKSSTSKFDVKCNGRNDGQFTIQPTGGTPPYYYSLTMVYILKIIVITI